MELTSQVELPLFECVEGRGSLRDELGSELHDGLEDGVSGEEIEPNGAEHARPNAIRLALRPAPSLRMSALTPTTMKPLHQRLNL